MDLPQPLHAQLYLLSYDRVRHRFCCGDDDPLLGFALRAAMLTDLYLSDELQDRGGRAYATTAVGPADPLLGRAFRDARGRSWDHLIADDSRNTACLVRRHLSGAGWLCVQQYRRLGVIPTTRVVLYDEDMVSGLAGRVDRALLNAIGGLAAEPRPLAIGLIGILGQIPTISCLLDSAHHRAELRELILATIEPILGLHRVVLTNVTSGFLFDKWHFAHGGP